MPCKKNCFVCAATVVLDFRQACSGEILTYTCAVNQGFALDWIVEPFLNGSTHIYGSCWVVHPLKGVYTAEVSHFHNVITLIDFVAMFTNTTNPMTVRGGTLADMTSTLRFTAATRLNGTVVQCRGRTASEFPTTNLNIAGASVLQQQLFHDV